MHYRTRDVPGLSLRAPSFVLTFYEKKYIFGFLISNESDDWIGYANSFRRGSRSMFLPYAYLLKKIWILYYPDQQIIWIRFLFNEIFEVLQNIKMVFFVWIIIRDWELNKYIYELVKVLDRRSFCLITSFGFSVCTTKHYFRLNIIIVLLLKHKKIIKSGKENCLKRKFLLLL